MASNVLNFTNVTSPLLTSLSTSAKILWSLKLILGCLMMLFYIFVLHLIFKNRTSKFANPFFSLVISLGYADIVMLIQIVICGPIIKLSEVQHLQGWTATFFEVVLVIIMCAAGTGFASQFLIALSRYIAIARFAKYKIIFSARRTNIYIGLAVFLQLYRLIGLFDVFYDVSTIGPKAKTWRGMVSMGIEAVSIVCLSLLTFVMYIATCTQLRKQRQIMATQGQESQLKLHMETNLLWQGLILGSVSMGTVVCFAVNTIKPTALLGAVMGFFTHLNLTITPFLLVAMNSDLRKIFKGAVSGGKWGQNEVQPLPLAQQKQKGEYNEKREKNGANNETSANQ